MFRVLIQFPLIRFRLTETPQPSVPCEGPMLGLFLQMEELR